MYPSGKSSTHHHGYHDSHWGEPSQSNAYETPYNNRSRGFSNGPASRMSFHEPTSYDNTPSGFVDNMISPVSRFSVAPSNAGSPNQYWHKNSKIIIENNEGKRLKILYESPMEKVFTSL